MILYNPLFYVDSDKMFFYTIQLICFRISIRFMWIRIKGFAVQAPASANPSLSPKPPLLLKPLPQWRRTIILWKIVWGRTRYFGLGCSIKMFKVCVHSLCLELQILTTVTF
jgi:hypothetical protein